jgi:hypothetical protein
MSDNTEIPTQKQSKIKCEIVYEEIGGAWLVSVYRLNSKWESFFSGLNKTYLSCAVEINKVEAKAKALADAREKLYPISRAREEVNL